MERAGLAAIEQIAPQSRNRLQSVSVTKGKLALPVVLYLIAVMLPIGFNLGPLYLNLIRLVLLATVIPLTLRLLSGEFGGVLFPDIFFFLHVSWIIVAISVNDPDRALQYVGSTAIEFIGSYVLARAYIRTSEDFLLLCRALVLMILLTLPFALYELVTNNPPILQFLDKIPGIRTERVVRGADEMRMGLFRAQVMFPHPIHYGIFASMGFTLCFVGLKGIYGNTKRYIASGITMLSTFTSLSSGAFLPVMLQVGLIIWAWLFNFTRYRWLILGLMFVIAYIAVDILSNRGPILVFMSYATFSPWNAYWRALIFDFGMDNVWANPWFGIGITADWVRPEWMQASSVDNFWLVIALRYGIPGFLLLAIGYLQPLWSIGRRKFNSDLLLWRQRRAWMFLFIGLGLALATVHIWTTLYSFVFFMFGAGMWFVTVIPKQAEKPGTGLGTSPVTDRPSVPALTRGSDRLDVRANSAPAPAASGGPQYSRFAASVPPRHKRKT